MNTENTEYRVWDSVYTGEVMRDVLWIDFETELLEAIPTAYDQKLIDEDIKNRALYFPSGFVHRIQDVDLMKSTDTLDVNNKMIYSGDIIDIHQTVNGCSRFIIEWNRKDGFSARYLYEFGDLGGKYEYAFDQLIGKGLDENDAEIIGNIYEDERLIYKEWY